MDDNSLPIMEAKNNKETINLLDFLSESESTVSDIVLTTPKKKKVKRRYRSGAYSVKEKHGQSCGCGKSQTRVIALWLAAVSITFWLLALSWLAAILYSDIRKMDSNIRSVGAQDNTEGDSVVLLEMDSVAVTVPLRPPTKKMKKRKELDALAAPHAITRRNSGKRSSQELLTDSSDDRSEYWSVSTRGGRKCRGGRRGRHCPGFLRACSAFLACASVLATATLIWLFIDVRQQLSVLRTELDQVVAGNDGFPDVLQKFHSLSRDLQQNQTLIFANITDIKLQVVNFTIQLSNIQRGLLDVQEKIRAAPELVTVPNKLKDLSTEISKWGSEITDLASTTNSLKEAESRIENAQANILKNITTMEHSLADLSTTAQQPQTNLFNESKAQTELLSSTIAELVTNLSLVNTTLTRDVQWVKDDRDNYHKTMVELEEKTLNITAQVMSLNGECAKLTAQQTLRITVDNLIAEMDLVKKTDAKLQSQISTLENSYKLLQNSSDNMLATLTGLQNSKSNTAARNDSIAPLTLDEKVEEEVPKVTETESQSVSAGETAEKALQTEQESTGKEPKDVKISST